METVRDVSAESGRTVAELLQRRREQLTQRWADLPLFRAVFTVTRDEAVEACHTVIDALVSVAGADAAADLDAPGFDAIREQLGRMAMSRARAGQLPAQLDREVAALKQPVLEMFGEELADTPQEFRYQVLQQTTELVATLRLVVLQSMISQGQEIIARQRQQLLEMSTPVIKLWEGVVAVPLIGTLDSARSQVVMENLLDAVVAQQASVAILDITGVPTVDSLVAQHLMKTVAAARLMGAECIVSGIRPAIAQTIVQLGIELDSVTTRATLADALALALREKRRNRMPPPVDDTTGIAG